MSTQQQAATKKSYRGGRKKGDHNATVAQIQAFRRWREKGLSVAKAAEKVGLSKGWGYYQAQKDKEAGKVIAETDAPAPKKLSELDGGVIDCLKDFSLFEVTFLARRPVPWRKDAANRVIEMLNDDSVKDAVIDKWLVDINTPPGAGKTTLFTHDIPLWLICGGGVVNPEYGRAIRLLLGHEVQKIAEQYVMRLRRLFETLRRYSYYDKGSRQRFTAELSIVKEFGRFQPIRALGEQSLWMKYQFTVAQIGDVELAEKEPTVQAGSREGGQLGTRVDLYSWDDIATRKNSTSVEVAESLNEWFADESETRLEPGGVGMIVGQRLGPLDLHRQRLDASWIDDDGVEHPLYQHIIFPAHFEEHCDGNHRQWDGGTDGCLLDAQRLSWRELLKKQSQPNYRTVYQQEDANPHDVLVLKAWLEGGTDPDGYPAPGCYDHERGFFEWPRVKNMVNYATVDPAAGNWWAIEWWAIDPVSKFRYLIYGTRKRLDAGQFLDWDNKAQKHVGVMEDLQNRSCELGQPILMWVVEQNAAHKYLFQFEHYFTWRRKWAMVDVQAHTTGLNKTDSKFGVDALLKMPYKQGTVRLPRRKGDIDSLNYMRIKIYELTTYPFSRTDDTVLSEWFGAFKMKKILQAGKNHRGEDDGYTTENAPEMSPHLRAQQQTVTLV